MYAVLDFRIDAFKPDLTMISRIWNCLSTALVTLFVFFQPVFAFAQDDKPTEESIEWVLSYFLVLLCLGLAVLILLRPCNRSESAFTQEELDAQKAEAIKKMTGSHTG